MSDRQRLRRIIRELVEKELDEISTSGAAGPYMTPGAFAPKTPSAQKGRNKRAQVLGYTLANGWERGEKDASSKKVDENRYLEFKNNPLPPHRKIGMAVSEMNRALSEAERILNMSHRLKKESNMDSTQMWSRTNKTLMKMEVRLLTAVKRIREMRS